MELKSPFILVTTFWNEISFQVSTPEIFSKLFASRQNKMPSLLLRLVTFPFHRSFTRQPSWTSTPTQSNSFKVIQKITNTDGEDDDNQVAVEQGPRSSQQYQQAALDQMRRIKLNEGDRALMNKFKQGEEDEIWPIKQFPNLEIKILISFYQIFTKHITMFGTISSLSPNVFFRRMHSSSLKSPPVIFQFIINF